MCVGKDSGDDESSLPTLNTSKERFFNIGKGVYSSDYSSSFSPSKRLPSFQEDRPSPTQTNDKLLGPFKLDDLCSTPGTISTTTRSSTQLDESTTGFHKIRKKRDATEEFLIGIVRKEEAFQRLPPQEVVNAMYKMLVWTGETIFRQGNIIDTYFIVSKGKLDVLIENRNGKMEKISEVEKGATLGVNGLMGSTKHTTTVKATRLSTVWALEAMRFRKLLRKYRSRSFDARFLGRLAFLKTVPIMKRLPELWLEHVATILQEVPFAKGATIVRQRDPPSFFYIIKRGTAVVLKALLHGDPVEIHTYGSGDFFGERGLIKNEPRAATVVATSELLCYVLGETDFAKISKLLSKEFNNVMANYSEAKQPKVEKFANRIKTKLEEFQNLGVLGIGSFGRVSLVKDPSTGLTYSLKSVKKKRVVETGQQEHMKNEREIMALMDSPFIVKLFATYKDRISVYFLMEAVLGGELFTVLRWNNKFSERTSRFYGTCCIEGFEHMHGKNVIYRDLKPENLLIDSLGYIKITDFGFAKKRNHTFTLCGTPEYLAPEVIQNWTQSFAVDWWGLGILLYEMVVSHPPFEDESHLKMYEKIITKPVVYPRHVNPLCRDLIDALLRKNFYKRLGSGIGGAADVKRHSWFKNTDWEGLVARKLKSPYIPRIKSREDLSCFEYYPEEDAKDEELMVDGDSQVFAWTADF